MPVGIDCVGFGVCNVTTAAGETDGYTAADHLQAVLNHAGEKIVGTGVLVNSQRARPGFIKRYRGGGGPPVQIDDTPPPVDGGARSSGADGRE